MRVWSSLLSSGVLMLGLLFLFSLFPACEAQSIVNINLTNTTIGTENVSVMENSWVKLQGGVDVSIPKLTFVYNGFNKTSYSKEGRGVNITINVTENTNHVVQYPNTTHQFFYNDSTVEIDFNTSLNIAAYYYIAKTDPTEVRDIGEAIQDGNTSRFRDLFFNHSTYNGTVNLPNGNISISNPQAGDYIIILTDNRLNESDFTIISSTLIEVLEYKSNLTAPSSIEQNEDLVVTMNITAPTNVEYRYGGALIKKDVYEKKREIRVTSNKTKSTTNLTIDSVSLIENWKIAGVGLGNVGASKAQEILNDIIGANNGSVKYIEPTNSIAKEITFDTDDLPAETYTLSVGVWQGSNKLVAFNQTEIEIVAPTPTPTPTPVPPSGGGGGGGGGAPPAVPISETDVPTKPTGEVTTTVTAKSPDKKVTITIPAGIIAKDAKEKPLTIVSIARATLPAAPPSGVIYLGYAYEFGPTGATFSKPIKIAITFDPASLPEGTKPVIYTYDSASGEWKALDTEVMDNEAFAYVTHFSIFALFAAKETLAVIPPTSFPTLSPTPAPTVTPAPSPTPIPKLVFPVLNIVTIVGIVVAIVIVVLYVVKRRRG
jgi:methanogen extracellular protein (TIGR04279 family)